MPDDTDLTAEPTEATSAVEDATSTEPSASDALINLALKDLQAQRDALEAEIAEMTSRKQQLEDDLRTSFAGQSDALARRVKGFQDYLGGALQDLVQSVETVSYTHLTLPTKA